MKYYIVPNATTVFSVAEDSMDICMSDPDGDNTWGCGPRFHEYLMGKGKPISKEEYDQFRTKLLLGVITWTSDK